MMALPDGWAGALCWPHDVTHYLVDIHVEMSSMELNLQTVGSGRGPCKGYTLRVTVGSLQDPAPGVFTPLCTPLCLCTRFTV